MSHIALYRAWRPQTFGDMVGQQHIIQTLQNAIREQRVSHAYLFNGPRGTGKTTAAKVLAKAVNCERGPKDEPCNECGACRGITAGHIMDVIEIDAASNRGIDEIRDIRDKVRYAPSEVRFKVYIIDEVHMLTSEAFNALLKTLEEPPAHVIFILATTEPHKLPATIVSRCQRFDFRRASLEEQTKRLMQICSEEHISAEEEALAYIARLSEGGMRDAISLLEQISAFGNGSITLNGAIDVTGGMESDDFCRIAESVRDRNVADLLALTDKMMQAGKSVDKCMENLIYYFRDMLVLQLAPSGAASSTEGVVDRARLQAVAESYTSRKLFAMIEVLNRYQAELKYATQPQTLFEVALMKLCALTEDGSDERTESGNAGRADAAAPSSEILRLRGQVDALERKLEAALKERGSLAATAGGAGEARSSAGAVRGASRGGFGASGGGLLRSKVKLDPYLASEGSTASNAARMKWAEVLRRVKEAKVTLHAWLKDGELVSVHDGHLLLAFKNEIHRETTEKPSHREMIEQVASEVLGEPLRLVTVMLKEWQDAREDGGDRPGEVLELEAESIDVKPLAPKRPEWIEEAVKQFGADLVVVEE